MKAKSTQAVSDDGDPRSATKRNPNMMKMARARSSSPTLAALAGSAAVLALPLTGCGADDDRDGASPGKSAAAREAVTVDIASFKFMPEAVKVKAGGTVTFVNRDKAPHTAQTELNSKQAEFDTARLTKGERKAVTLRGPGRFEYFCAYHRFMEGTVEVVE